MKNKMLKALLLAGIFVSLIFGFASQMQPTQNAEAAGKQVGETCTITGNVSDCDKAKGLACDTGTKTCQIANGPGWSCAGINNVASDGLCNPSGSRSGVPITVCDPNSLKCVEKSNPKGVGSSCAKDSDCSGTDLKCIGVSSGIFGTTNGTCQKSASEGQSCTAEADCNPLGTDLHCRADASGKKICVKGDKFSVPTGGTCSNDNQCPEGEKCLSSKCGKTSGATSCSDNSDCSSGQFCSKFSTSATGTCRLTTGSTCTDTRECGLYKVCKSGKCEDGVRENGKIGAYCQDTAAGGQAIKIACDSGLVCENNKCVTPKNQAQGFSCENNTQCQTGTTCKDGKCTSDGSTALAGLNCNNNVAKGFFTQNVSNPCINCGECTICDIMNVATGAGQSLLGIAAPIAGLVLVIAGTMYTTSAGNPDRVQTAKRALLGAIIGLIIMLGSYLLVQAVMAGIGVQNTGSLLAPTYSNCNPNAWKWTGFGTGTR